MKTKRKIPEILIEQLLLDELPKGISARKKEDLLKDPYVAKRLKEIKKSNKEILTQFSPDLMVLRIKEKYSNETKVKKIVNFRHVMFSFASAAAALIIVFLIYIPLNNSNNINITDKPEIINIKGSTDIKIHKQTESGQERLEGNSTVKENDRLQISYLTHTETHGIILSIDGRGYVTLHHPEALNASTLLIKNEETYLLNSYKLDDAPEFERFFIVYSETSFSIEEIITAAEVLTKNSDKGITGKLELPIKVEQSSILLLKE